MYQDTKLNQVVRYIKHQCAVIYVFQHFKVLN